MIEVQAVHGIPVSERAMGLAELVVSELVTNAHKYAPGPCLLDLEVGDGTVEISVWDSDPTLPVPQEADPHRVGKHGLSDGASRSAGARFRAVLRPWWRGR
jgi:anti-sigma regulatory factor (Ser/Thr protein kinase)